MIARQFPIDPHVPIFGWVLAFLIVVKKLFAQMAIGKDEILNISI